MCTCILIEAIQFVHKNNKNEFHLQHDLHLTVNQFSNFTKLRFCGLVAKVDGKAGYWLITKRGGQFLRGEIAVPLKVKTFRKKVLEHSHELIHINELKGKVPVFEQQYAFEHQRPKVEPGLFICAPVACTSKNRNPETGCGSRFTGRKSGMNGMLLELVPWAPLLRSPFAWVQRKVQVVP